MASAFHSLTHQISSVYMRLRMYTDTIISFYQPPLPQKKRKLNNNQNYKALATETNNETLLEKGQIRHCPTFNKKLHIEL